jgi:thioredoxin-dependent adenylylsulfate APS reductase
MADADPESPIHEPTVPFLVEENDWVQETARRFETASADALLRWGIQTFGSRIAISAAGGVDGTALIDMAWRISPDIRVFTLDTGRLPQETYRLFDRLHDRYGIEIEFERPDPDGLGALMDAEGPDLMYRSLDLRVACCNVRKVEPLKRKLSTLDAWVTGLRREQWESRRRVAKVEVDRAHGGIVKLNPLADWTLDLVWDYVRRNDVPYHELFDRGYSSIGCEPCTRAVSPGEPERAGRWWWEQDTNKECGIHCSVQLMGSPSDRERAEQTT